MERNTVLIMRFPADVKSALRKAAEDDHRSMSSLVLKLVSDYLVAQGFVQMETGATKRARKG